MVAKVPEEVGGEVFYEEVLAEIAGEVCQLVSEKVHAFVLGVLVNCGSKPAMEKRQEGVVLFKHLEQNAGVFLAKLAVLEAGVCDCLAGGCNTAAAIAVAVLVPIIDTVERVRVLDYDVEPDIGLDLANDVRVRAGGDALDRGLDLGERLEEAHDALADAGLLSLLVDVHSARVEEVDLAVGELLLCRLSWAFRQQSRVNDKHRADLYLGEHL